VGLGDTVGVAVGLGVAVGVVVGAALGVAVAGVTPPEMGATGCPLEEEQLVANVSVSTKTAVDRTAARKALLAIRELLFVRVSQRPFRRPRLASI
jgi:hypothetical protein